MVKESYKCVLKVFHGYFMDISRVFQKCSRITVVPLGCLSQNVDTADALEAGWGFKPKG